MDFVEGKDIHLPRYLRQGLAVVEFVGRRRAASYPSAKASSLSLISRSVHGPETSRHASL